VVVYKDVGGLVTDYQAQTELYRREGREVRLHECRSACTLALSLPNVCVYPDSLVKFHLAYNAIDRQTDAGVSAELFRSYPAAVQERLGYLTRQYKVLTGSELISLGIRNCNGSDRTMIARARGRAPSPAPAGLSDPLRDIADKVQGAVAQAFGDPTQPPQGPIRLALADRSPLRPAPLRDAVDPTPTGAIRMEAEAETPAPPRRPPLLAFAEADAQAPRPFAVEAPVVAGPPLLPGGAPILPAGSFRLPRMARFASQ
jgi:hypothetical protein